MDFNVSAQLRDDSEWMCGGILFFSLFSSSASVRNPPALMAKRFSRFLHEFCAKFSIIIALWHVHIRGYGADMLIKCIGSVCVLPLSFRISRCHTRHFTGAFFCTGFNWQPCYTLHTLEGLSFLQFLKNLLKVAFSGLCLWASKGQQRHPRSIGLDHVLPL